MTASKLGCAVRGVQLLFQFYISPQAAFKRVLADNCWWAPLVLYALCDLLFYVAVTPAADLQALFDQSLGMSQSWNPQQVRVLSAAARGAAQFQALGVLANSVVAVIAVAGALVVCLRVALRVEKAAFTKTLVVATYSCWTVAMIGGLLAVLAKWGPAKWLLDWIEADAALLLSRGAPSWLSQAGHELNLFSLCTALLLAEGGVVVAAGARIRVAACVLVLWLAWVGLKAGAVTWVASSLPTM